MIISEFKIFCWTFHFYICPNYQPNKLRLNSNFNLIVYLIAGWCRFLIVVCAPWPLLVRQTSNNYWLSNEGTFLSTSSWISNSHMVDLSLKHAQSKIDNIIISNNNFRRAYNNLWNSDRATVYWAEAKPVFTLAGNTSIFTPFAHRRNM